MTKQREFTIWLKRDRDTPGSTVAVSEKPHRNILIGYEEIDVMECRSWFIAPRITVSNSDIEIDEVKLEKRLTVLDAVITSRLPSLSSLMATDERKIPEIDSVSIRRKTYRLMPFGFDITNRRVEVEIYVDEEFMRGQYEREKKINLYVKERAPWFFSYGVRGDLRGPY